MPEQDDADRSEQPQSRPSSLAENVAKKEQRKIAARKEATRGIWFGLGMFGVVGWSVAIPTLIGIAVGIWLDRMLGSRISCTITCLVVGIALGCSLAWYWIKQETTTE